MKYKQIYIPTVCTLDLYPEDFCICAPKAPVLGIRAASPVFGVPASSAAVKRSSRDLGQRSLSWNLRTESQSELRAFHRLLAALLAFCIFKKLPRQYCATSTCAFTVQRSRSALIRAGNKANDHNPGVHLAYLT